jgi:tetratricopeptide (TPR) repeat protein
MQKIILNLFILAALSSAVYSQTTPSTLIKGVEGINPTAYYALSQEANQLFQQKDYAKAAEAYEKLTKAYPLDGETWYFFGRALYESGQFRAAGQAFDKVDELGVRAYISVPNSNFTAYTASFPRLAALGYMRANEPERALDWLEKAVVKYHLESPQTLFQDKVFAPLKDNPRFIKLAGAPVSAAVSRVKGWRGDLDFLLTRLRLTNPVYSQRPLPVQINQAAERLRKQIPNLSDVQIAVEMQHLLALLGQSHNTFYFPYIELEGERVAFTKLPLTFYLFPEGLFIIDASKEYENLIGSRVVSFDDTLAEKAIEATQYLKDRENDVEIAHGSPVFLALPQVLHALKLTRRPERVELTIIDSSGQKRTVTPEPVPNKGGQRRLEASRLPNAPKPPLYLTRPDDLFWFEPLPEHKTLYVQFNEVGRKPNETLAQFGLKLRKFLAENDVKNLIVDVRCNNGGNTYFYTELLRTLIAFDAQEGNRIYVPIARKTFSAAQNFITDVDRLTDAVFVGEPSGGKPITIGGDLTNLTLPYSGLRLGIAGATWQLTSPRDTRLWIAPEVPVALTAKDYFSNRDPAMEAIISLIRKDTGK